MRAAVDIGGTKLLAAIELGDGRLGPLLRRRTPDGDPIGALGSMLDEVRGGRPLEAVAIAVPGPFD
ncbi:MAG TPA: ROK family protein, partial [Candidatus Dormibacteraeota bacterium]|nr:ROK family protein [Candidatus Dormibacteraeota bacterium]